MWGTSCLFTLNGKFCNYILPKWQEINFNIAMEVDLLGKKHKTITIIANFAEECII